MSPRPAPLHIAAVQLNGDDDPARNLAQALDEVASAAAAGASVVCLPENVVYMGDTRRRAGLAESLEDPLTGPLASALVEAARARGVWLLVGGFPERSPERERPFNTAFVVDPSGTLRARYRKLHLFDVDLPDGRAIRESGYTAPGDEPALVDVAGWGVGLSICYDVRFPELYRRYAAGGARVLFVPSAFTVPTGEAHWHLLLRARAVENQCYVVAPAQWGVHGTTGRSSYGHTLIVDPWGTVLAERTSGVGWVSAALNPVTQDELRGRLPVLTHRRL
jgi:predicted amidohydrolase